ncbi:MAG TPA: hypothetical protein VFO86_14675, partial [Terriglobia bacterium]|nr:hypothetical protein [Terriglobia bacterium]
RRGLLYDWQFNITNTHLKLFEEAGFEEYLQRFGYDPIGYFKESDYTPDQLLIEEHIRRGQPYVENLDDDLITFAFNKTNFTPSSRFKFKHYPRQGAIEIERSTVRDEALEAGFMARMMPVSETVFSYLQELQQVAEEAAAGNEGPLGDLRERYSKVFSEWLGDRAESMFSALLTRTDATSAPPRLVGSAAGYNIVYLGGHHYSVPQSLGPMDLGQLDRSTLPSTIVVTRTYEEALQAIARRAKT